MSSSGREEFFTMRLCSDGVAYNVTPRRRLMLNLNMLRDRNVNGVEVLAQTEPIAVLKLPDGVEATVARNGKLVIRDARDDSHARRAALAVYSTLRELTLMR